MSSTQSAVIVPVPEAETAVAAHRSRFDRAANWGVPAHVTALFPFMPPKDIDSTVMNTLAAAVASVPKFHVVFERTDWFDTDVLWLAPEPAENFRLLTTALTRVFPAHQPYGGAHDEVTPHLTVGHNAPLADLRAATPTSSPTCPSALRSNGSPYGAEPMSPGHGARSPRLRSGSACAQAHLLLPPVGGSAEVRATLEGVARSCADRTCESHLLTTESSAGPARRYIN
jgi:hypothetical protein